MEWVVENQLVCPQTGTFFALASGAKNLKLILWYKGNYFIRSGNVIRTGYFGLHINGRARSLEILHAFPFSQPVWNTFKSAMNCPGNDGNMANRCLNAEPCLFQLCPYGLTSL